MNIGFNYWLLSFIIQVFNKRRETKDLLIFTKKSSQTSKVVRLIVISSLFEAKSNHLI